MIHFFKSRFMDLKIRQKIAIGMVLLALITALVVGIFCSVSFIVLYTEQSNSEMDNTLDVTAQTMNGVLGSLYRSTTYMLSGTQFSNIYQATAGGSRDPEYLEHVGLLQEPFSAYLRSNSLLDSVVLLSAGGDIYSTYDAGMNYNSGQFSQELAQTSITWLQARTNPMNAGETQVIPVCFPMSYQDRLLLTGGKKSSLVLVAYVNADRLALSMEQTNRAAFSRIYLSDPGGMPLSVKTSDSMYRYLADSAFRKRLVASRDRGHFMADFSGESYSTAAQKISISGLRIVSIVSYGKMLQSVYQIQRVTFAAVLLSLIIALLIAAGLSSTITTPIKNLVGQVKKMRAGDYSLKPVTKYNDEIHMLDGALCDMSRTVVEQMENIKTTEMLRRKAELAAITEQISPHFLYNTLDCIHWEILGGQQQVAASMVESLGTFLRLSLNHGREISSFPEAVEHTRQYINLMNHRFQSRIRFIYTIPPELTRFQVPKMILQPLAENSILHGFGGQQLDPGVKTPTISVTARRQGDLIAITMEDNGHGIDVVKARESLLASAGSCTHVGLQNVYSRLVYCFGPKVEVRFSSIPYYKNEVTLLLPFTEISQEDRTVPPGDGKN